MKRFIVTLLAVAGLITPLTAQNTDYIHVKNGSVFEGFISMQEPGTAISVTAQSATLIVKAEDISNLAMTSKPVAKLPELMRNWLNKNRAGETEIEVASLKISGIQYDDVLVLEKGSRYKLLSFNTHEYNLNWGDIIKTRKNEAFQKKNSGICDVVTLKNGKRFKGVITEQTIGVELKIKHEKNSVETIRFSDILSIHTEQVDSKANLWKLIPLLDKVELNDGSELTGFISSRMMGQSIIFVSQNSAVERSIALKDIAKYRKVVNSQYKAANKAPQAVVTNEPKEADEPEEVATEEEEATDDEAQKNSSEERDGERASRWGDNDSDNDNTNATKTETKTEAETPANQPLGITVNGKSVSLNLVQEKDGVHYLIYDVVDIVPHGRNIRINLPMSINASEVKIVKLRAYDSPDSDSRSLPGWTDEDAERYTVPFISIDADSGIDGRWHMEIKADDINPGTYALIPLIATSRCLSFKVRP